MLFKKKNKEFYSDMAVDCAEKINANDLIKKTELGNGVIKSSINLKNQKISNELGKKKGLYVTFESKNIFYEEKERKNLIVQNLAKTLKEMTFTWTRTIPSILVVGLGNPGMVADSLGAKVVDRLIVTRHLFESGNNGSYKAKVAAVSPDVLGVTGIQSFDIVKGVVDEIKPDCVLVVDTLCTAKISRLYSTFQLTTAGISPASGVGQVRKPFEHSTIGVPVVSIGVPLVGNLREVILRFIRGYNDDKNINVAKYEDLMQKYIAKNTIVAPKEIDLVVTECSKVIAQAINLAFIGKQTKDFSKY